MAHGAGLKAQGKDSNIYYGAQGFPKILSYHCPSTNLMVDFGLLPKPDEVPIKV
jgi:hypothetical protein